MILKFHSFRNEKRNFKKILDKTQRWVILIARVKEVAEMNDATKAAKILGGLTSKRKARAARINGKKGGRPRTAQKEQELSLIHI